MQHRPHLTYSSWRWFGTLPTENQSLYFFTLYLGGGIWLLWAMECSKIDAMWLMKLGNKTNKRSTWFSLGKLALGTKTLFCEKTQASPEGKITERTWSPQPTATIIHQTYEWKNVKVIPGPSFWVFWLRLQAIWDKGKAFLLYPIWKPGFKNSWAP